MSVTTRTNLATNPAAASTTNYAALAGTGGTAALTNQTNGGAYGSTYNRVTWSVATTAVSGGATYTEPSGIAASTAYAIQVWVRSSVAQTVQLKADFRNSSNTIVNTSTGSSVALTAGAWTKLSVVGTSGAAVTNVVLTVQAVTGGVNWAVGNTLDIDAVLPEAPPVARTNLCTNPSFEIDLTGWSTAGTPPTLTRDTTQFSLGVASMKVVWPTAGLDTTAARFSANVTSGVTYTLSADVFVPVGQPSVNLLIGAGAEVKSAASSITGAWQRLTVTIASSTTGSGYFDLRPVAASTSGQYAYIDKVLIEAAGTGGAYFDGATAEAPTTLYGWTGTPNASTSVALTTPFTYFDGSLTSAGGVVYAWAATANASTSTATTYAPYITLSTGTSPSPYVQVTVQDLDPSTDVVNIWRTVDGKRRAVRGGRRRSVIGSDFVNDYEAPLGRSTAYDLEILSGVCAGVAVTTATTTITGQACGWLSDPMFPGSAIPVYPDVGPNGEPALDDGALAQLDYVAAVQQFIVAGTDEPVALIGQRQAAANVAVNVTTLSTSQAATLRALIKQAAVLLFRPLPGWASALPGLCYVAAATISELPFERYGAQMVTWQIPATVYSPPASSIVVPTTTYGTVAGSYATYAAFNAAHTGQTYLDVLKNP